MSSFRSFLLIMLAMSFYACQEDDNSEKLPDLQMYLDRFAAEAQRRGYDLDLSEVEAAYVDRIERADDNYCGMGFSNYFNNNIRRIEISTDPGCNWATMSDVERERLFFHEIGHAFLNRGHDNAKRCDGSPLSLMTVKIGLTYDDADSEERDYYISELIDRLAAADQCIQLQDFSNNPVFYRAFEGDDRWIFDSDDNDYTGIIGKPAGEQFRLAITSNNENNEKNGYWYRNFSYPNIPECAEVSFQATINAEELAGPGVALSLRAYHAPLSPTGAQTEQYLRISSEENPISGKLEDYTQTLTLPCFSRETSYIVVFLVMLPGTTGEAKFTDVQLVVKEEDS